MIHLMILEQPACFANQEVYSSQQSSQPLAFGLVNCLHLGCGFLSRSKPIESHPCSRARECKLNENLVSLILFCNLHFILGNLFIIAVYIFS